jgi:hypothetical protein
MNCRRADQLFSAAWEDELTLVERETLESHIAACAACRVAYDEFVRVMEAVQGLPKMEAGPEFAEGVWSRIRAAGSPKAHRRFAWSWGVSFRPALAAAACLVVVGGAVVYWQHNHPVGSETNPSPVTVQKQAPSPVAMAPVTGTPPAPTPAKASKRDLPVQQVAIAQPRKTSANGAPASVSAGAAKNLVASTSLAAAKQDSTAPVDSLFDHSYDVEFALDPVHLSKSAKGKLSPSRPMPTEVQGKPAKVTF